MSKIYFLLYKKNCLRFYKLILNLRGLVWLPLSAISHRLNPPHNEWGGGTYEWYDRSNTSANLRSYDHGEYYLGERGIIILPLAFCQYYPKALARRHYAGLQRDSYVCHGGNPSRDGFPQCLHLQDETKLGHFTHSSAGA